MAKLEGLPFEGELRPDGALRVRGTEVDRQLRRRARRRGWVKEERGPRWLHPTGGVLPLL